MSKRTIILNSAGLIIGNLVMAAIVICLQALFFATNPPIDNIRPFTGAFDKKMAIFEKLVLSNKTLLIELLIGAVILLVINYRSLKQKTEAPIPFSVFLLLLYFFFTVSGLVYFTTDYINNALHI